MMIKLRQIRVIALLLTIVLLTSSVPVSVYAVESRESTAEITEEVSGFDEAECEVIPNDEVQNDIIFSEVVSRREESVKHFDLGYGRFQAVTYGNAVHRKDANGVWQDIDNRLYPAKDNANLYATADGRTVVSANARSSEALVTLRENGYTIALTPVLTKTSGKLKAASAAQIQNHKENKIDSDRTLSIEEATKISNTTTVRYADVFSSVDIEYLLSGNDIKENIVVKAPQSEYIYTFVLKVENLTPELLSTGQILLKDSTTGEEEYFIPAPYMYDAEGERSYDVYYELSGEKGAYILRVVAEKKWINDEERTFPVVIDPTFKRRISWDTYISSSAPDQNYGKAEEMWISSGKIAFIRNQKPTIPDGATIDHAEMFLYYYFPSGVTGGTLTAGAYRVMRSWTEGDGTSGLTWNIANPNSTSYISSTQSSSVTFDGSAGASASAPQLVSFDMTSLIKAWQDGSVSQLRCCTQTHKRYSRHRHAENL